MAEHKYGRGKFEAHENYIRYMRMIVEHPNFEGMPNATSPDGRINWQVSSGKKTSFYKDYLARKTWWENKADELGVEGTGDEGGRFTVTARLNHPTGYRACRLCGEEFNVGYFYINHNFAIKLKKDFPSLDIAKAQPIDDIIDQLSHQINQSTLMKYFFDCFPERIPFFKKHGVTTAAFEKSNHIKSQKLSPGFMGNPPDRLDGFHDYDLTCRKANDPGRFDKNMRSYNHDRRTFEWWAEGNWAIADALYNSAGEGICVVEGCNEYLMKVSPDHVGPLACGFKQLPLFLPMCQKHNSSKNRRFTLTDVGHLMRFEQESGESTASFQIRSHWDKYKKIVKNDNDTKVLSNSLRSLQDMFIRVMAELFKEGQTRFLATLLHPEYAFLDVEFQALNPGTLTFDRAVTTKKITKLRKGLAVRTIRISFESLMEYAKKPIERRKMVRSDFIENEEEIRKTIRKISKLSHPEDEAWNQALSDNQSIDEKENKIAALFATHKVSSSEHDAYALELLTNLFDKIGASAEVDFSRYANDSDDLLEDVF